MPCDTITTQSIKLAKAMPELVKKALEESGWIISDENKQRIIARKAYDSLIWQAGKGISITSNNSEQQLSEISQAYSKTAVTWAAKRAGWSVSNQETNKLTLTRR